MASSTADGTDEPEQEIRLVDAGERWVATDVVELERARSPAITRVMADRCE